MRSERTKTSLTRGKDCDGAIKHIDKLQRIEESKENNRERLHYALVNERTFASYARTIPGIQALTKAGVLKMKSHKSGRALS
jgi:hypothetical protein